MLVCQKQQLLTLKMTPKYLINSAKLAYVAYVFHYLKLKKILGAIL